MPLNWRDYYYLAKFLERVTGWDDFSADAARRSCVSRAYYAAFCHARNHAMRQWKFKPSGHGEDHGALRAEYRRQRRPEVAARLQDLVNWRTCCDYDDDVQNLPTLAKNSVQRAKEVINLLTFLGTPPVE
jgi:hypothetical protein